MTSQKKIEPIWKQLINIGAAEDLLRNEMQEHVILLKEALNFKYIRFWSIFSKELLLDVTNEKAEFNFSKLDLIIDFILKVNLKPFINLEQKTKRINKNPRAAMFYEVNKVDFGNLKQWETVVEALMRHWVKRYGQDELSGWKMEIAYDRYYNSVQDDVEYYFELFNRAYRIVKNYVPNFEVGGCLRPPEYMEGTDERKSGFWKLWSQERCRLDFISVLNYAYEQDMEKTGKYSRRSTDDEYLRHSVQRLKKDLKTRDFLLQNFI